MYSSKNSCVINLYPTNNDKSKRLHNAQGFCDLFQTYYEFKFREIAFSILLKEKNKFIRKLNKEISKLQKIPQLKFNHNITSLQFTPEALNIFMSLENNLDRYYRQEENEPVSQAKVMISDISKNYSELEDSLLEIINRGFGNKKYKQKTKTFLSKYIPTKRACSRFIKYVKKYRRKLLLRNNILNGIFTGRKGDLETTHETLSKFDYLYFRDYWDTEIDYFKRNTGRGIVNGELEDVKLAPSHNIYYDDNPDIIFSHFYHEEVKPIPIFKLLAKKILDQAY